MSTSRSSGRQTVQMMQEKGKPETEQARYRKLLNTLSAKVVVLEAAAHPGELEVQQR